MMPRVVVFAPLVLWGIWAFLPKLAIRRLGDETTAFVFQSLGSVLGAVLVWLLTRKPRESLDASVATHAGVDLAGIAFAVTAGVLGAVGLLFYLRAVARENVAVVASVTALYPLVAALLGRFVLGESLSPKQLCGMALAVVAVVLLGGESAH